MTIETNAAQPTRGRRRGWIDDWRPGIPAIFRARAAIAVAGGAEPMAAERSSRRLSGAVIGIAGAGGAFGGVLVNLAFRQSFLTSGNGDAAYLAFIAFYVLCAAVTWTVYLRFGSRLRGV